MGGREEGVLAAGRGGRQQGAGARLSAPGAGTGPRISDPQSWAFRKVRFLRSWARGNRPPVSPVGCVRAHVKGPGVVACPTPALTQPLSWFSFLVPPAQICHLCVGSTGTFRCLLWAWGQSPEGRAGKGAGHRARSWVPSSPSTPPPVVTLLFRVVGRGHGSFIINMII